VPTLDPQQVRVRAGAQGRLDLHLPGGGLYENARVVPAFPISRPGRFLYLLDRHGKEIGLLVDPKQLDRQSRELVLAEADQAHFMPRIRRIMRVQDRLGVARWEVQTDRGWSSFTVVSRSESVWFIGRNRVLIRDADGDRYLIEDLAALDRRSRQLAELHI